MTDAHAHATRYGRVPVAPPEEELAAMLAMDNYFEFPSDSESDDEDFVPPTSAVTRQDREDAEEENKLADDTDFDIEALLKPNTEYDDYMALFAAAPSTSYESSGILGSADASLAQILPQQPLTSTSTAWPTPIESANASFGHLSQGHPQPLMPMYPYVAAASTSSQQLPALNAAMADGHAGVLQSGVMMARDENARPESTSPNHKRRRESSPAIKAPPSVLALPASASDAPSLDFSRSTSVEDTEFYARNTQPPDAFRPRALDIPGSPQTKARLKKERSAIQSRQFRARRKQAQEDHSTRVQQLEQENNALKLQVAELQFRLQQTQGHLQAASMHLSSASMPLAGHVPPVAANRSM